MKFAIKYLLVLIAVFTLSGLSVPFATAQTLPPPDSIPVNEYLLMLPMPDLNGIDLPPIGSQEDARKYASRLLQNQASPLLNELRMLQEQGLVQAYKLLPEKQAILVQSSQESIKSQLFQLPGVQAFAPAKGENTCGLESFEALQEQVLGISRAQARMQSLDTKADETKISIQYRDGSNWGYVSGITTPSVDVTMRLFRAGQLITQETMTSSSEGDFYFSPSYESCKGYLWSLKAGDVVEITAAGKATSAKVLNLNVWVDPFSNQVSGTTAPEKSIEINLFVPQDNLCSSAGYLINDRISDAAGNFTVDFSSLIDFKNDADAEISVTSDNGHQIYTYQNAYQIIVNANYGQITFNLKPNSAYSVSVKRSDVVINSFSGITDFEGYDYVYPSEVLQPGDIITIQGGGRTLTSTAASFSNYYLNTDTNQLTATTDPGRKVRAFFMNRNRSWGYIQNSCSYSSTCASTTANNSGALTLNSSRILLRGDYVVLYLYDLDGNSQYREITSSAISTQVDSSYIEGYWSLPNRDVTVTLKNNIGEMKDVQTAWVWLDGSFSTSVGEIIRAGDTVTVTDGSRTETMTVADIRAELDKSTEQLTLYAPSGNAVINFNDVRHSEDSYYNICSEHQIINNVTSIALGEVSSQDSADIIFRGEDGHYTRHYAHAANINVMSWGSIYGYTMTPNQNITVNLLNGNTVLETKSLTSNGSGFYSVNFLFEPPIESRIQVVADQSEELVIPNITINQDVAGNRIYGTSPANQLLKVFLERIYLCYGNLCDASPYKIITANATGNYSAEFDESYFDNCSLAHVGGQCVNSNIDYFDNNENRYHIYKSFSDYVSADTWEDDNSLQNAKLYTGYQKHTFHYDDEQDWIKLTVTPADIGKTYHLMTTNLGPTMDTILYLYDAGGIQLAGDDDSGGGYASQITWEPAVSGTFYILVEPFNLNSTNNCGATYDFFIANDKVFLPLTIR